MRRKKIQREAEGYLELDMPRHAMDALSRLGEPNDFDSYSLYLWGEALRAMERYDEAISPLRRAAESMPTNIHVPVALAWCYKRTGQIKAAIDSLEKALAVEPTEALLHYNLACYWSLAGDKRRALEYLSQSLDIDPGCLSLIDDEPDFDPIRTDPRFQALCARQAAEG